MKFLTLSALIFAFLFGGGKAFATTLTVTNTNDAGPGSLRQAILDANGDPSSDVIGFEATAFSAAQTILLTSGPLVIENNGGLTINGPGMSLLSVSANNQSRVISLNGLDLTLNDLTIRDGNAGVGDGGGLRGNSMSIVNLHINNCLFINNVAGGPSSGGSGGAILNSGFGSTTINNSLFLNNFAGSGGGALVVGNLTMTSSILRGNFGRSAGAAISMGGTSLISSSLIANNTTSGDGAGLYNGSGTLTIVNSTVYGNSAGGTGGGIYNASSAKVNATNVTISSNRAGTDGSDDAGGVRNNNFTANAFVLKNTIISDNSRWPGAGATPDDIRGTFTSSGYNLIETPTGGTVVGDMTGNILGQDPKLGSLVSRHGNMPAAALSVGSPAIDAADPNNFPTTDQRGVTRPADGDGNGTASPDMGAFERDPKFDSPAFDFDGDGRTDIGIFRPSGGEWWVNRSVDGQTLVLPFGSSTDTIVPADFTGDGKADIAIFRPSSGEWYVLRSDDFSYFALPFGTNGDIPVPADYDADGKADFAVFRPSSSTWFITQSSGAPTRFVPFGSTGDQPVVSDYDGDGKADIGIFRPAASGAEWWIDRSTAGLLAMQFGASTDQAVQGDYTGDGKADIAIWRPSSGEWYFVRSENLSFYGFPFGTTGDVVAPGDYDGDGKYDVTVFRPSSATWFISRTTAGTQFVQFGANGDRPLPNSFVP